MAEIASAHVAIFPKFDAGFGKSVKDAASGAGKDAADGFNAKLGAGTKGTGESVGKSVGQGVDSGFKGSLVGLGGTLKLAMAGFAGGAIAAFVSSSVSSFAQLQDATAAAGVVFGDSMGKIITQSNEAAATLGMSKAQVIDAANVFGTYGKAAGLAGDDLAGFSTQMTQLAGDMASFRGTSPEQAIEAIGAAFRGETEPIRTYGVMLDDASIRQQALKMGLISTTKDALEPQQKTLAVQALILQQTSMAQGDFVRTSDSLANSQKTLSAEVENTKASIGEHLAPAMLSVTKLTLGLVSAFEANSAVVAPLATGFAVLGGAAIVLVGSMKALEVVRTVGGAFQVAGAGLEAFAGKMKLLSLAQTGAASSGLGALSKVAMSLGSALPVVGVAALAAGAAFLYMGAKSEESRMRIESFTDAIKADSGVIAENTKATVANALEKQGLFDAALTLGISQKQLTDAAIGDATAQKSVSAALDAATVSAVAYGDVNADALITIGKVRGALDGTNKELRLAATAADNIASATGAATGPTEDFAAVVADTAKAAKDAASEVAKETAAVWANVDAVLAASGSAIAYEASVDKASAAVKEHGLNLDITSDAGRAVKSAMDDMVKTGEAVVQSMIKQKAPASEVNAYLDTMHKNFLAAAGSSKEAQAKAEELWATYKLNPGVVKTLFTEAGQAETKQKVADLTAQINNVPKDHQTAFLAAVNAGDVAAAQAILDDVARARTAVISVRVSGIIAASQQVAAAGVSRFGVADGGLIKAMAAGGTVPGWSPHDRADNIPAMLTAGEFVQPVDVVDHYGVTAMEAVRNRRAAIYYGDGGQVAGQPVAGSSQAPASASGGYSVADLAAAVRAALAGAELRLTGAVDTIGDAVAGRILLAYEGAV